MQRIRRSVGVFTRAAWLLSAVLTSTLLPTEEAEAGAGKVEICHIPPGNPDNFHTLTIGAPAVPAHLAHGDYLGACENSCQLLGNQCDDGNACTADLCDASTGDCVVQPPVDCDDGNACTADSCNPTTGECQNLPLVGESCDDVDVCSVGDHCDAEGACIGTPLFACCVTAADCDDGNPCTDDACALSQCEHSPLTCDDGNECTADTCNPLDGYCTFADLVCDDTDPCTVDSCEPNYGCQTQPDESCQVCVEFHGACGPGVGTCCPGLFCVEGEWVCTSG